MEVWVSNFLWIAIVMGFACWWVTSAFWFTKAHAIVRPILCCALTFVAMTVLGGLVAVASHTTDTGFDGMASAIAADLGGAAAYFSEVGWETAVFWLPVMLIRASILLVRSRSQTKAGRTVA